MTHNFLTSRRKFLRNSVVAAGAITLSGKLSGAALAASGVVSAGAVKRANPAPSNKMSAALPAITTDIVLHTPHVIKEIGPDMTAELWTFEGSGPGPILHVMEGEPVNFTLDNNSGVMAHSIDFHAALLPWDMYYQAVGSGEKKSFTWTPKFPGVFMYHCGTPPVLMHIANGMHGAIVVEPKGGWPEKAAREYVLVQHEFYLSDPDDQGVRRGDYTKMIAARPDVVAFNGYVNQYQADPLVADPGELIRIHVCNAGPTLFSAFHVIGTLFTAVYADGNPANKQTGMQTVTIPPGGGYTVEMRIPDAGLYPFVTHSFAYTGLGALGVIKVGNPSMPASGAAH